jgi:uncharacterized membrane protein
MGDSEMASGKIAPIMVQDPMLAVYRVPVEGLTLTFVGIEDAARGLRMYFPRVYRQVHEGYDVLIIADAREPFFPPKIQGWFKDAVIDYGLGFLMAGGPQSFSGYEPWGHPSWEGSPVADLLPVTLLTDWQYAGKDFRLVPAPGQEDHPLIRNIPWKQVPLRDYNTVGERQGATTVGMRDKSPPGSPVLSFMDIGRGISEAFVYDWGGNSVREFHRWSYGSISISNLIYWVARVQIPEDMSLYRELRNQITRYSSLRDYTLSVVEFAEKFGANMNKADKALAASQSERKEVIGLYVNGDYGGSLEKLDSAMVNLENVADLALKAKDEALFWVYVIEWFIVSGTGMLCGTILWTLMVRRSAYREVGTTRFSDR